MLLCHTFKTYERLPANKIMKEIKGKVAGELYTFRAGRARTDQVFGIRQWVEKNWEYGKGVLVVFIDYKEAIW
jgi:hypothetical protein